MRRIANIFALLLVAAFACGGGRSAASEDGKARIQVDNAFSVLAPVGAKVRIDRGPDGFGGVIDGPNMQIGFTVSCCNELSESLLTHGPGLPDGPGIKVFTTTIAGHHAIIFRTPDPRHRAGVVMSALLIETSDGKKAELMMMTGAAGAKALANAEALYRSVRFGRE